MPEARNEHSALHTPGPWEWIGPGRLTRVPWSLVGGSSPNGIGILDTTRGPNNPADKALITAAPDLLQAARDLVRDRHDMFPCREVGGSGRPCPTCRALVAAIAKAEGRA